jgi:hypothetical protein
MARAPGRPRDRCRENVLTSGWDVTVSESYEWFTTGTNLLVTVDSDYHNFFKLSGFKLPQGFKLLNSLAGSGFRLPVNFRLSSWTQARRGLQAPSPSYGRPGALARASTAALKPPAAAAGPPRLSDRDAHWQAPAPASNCGRLSTVGLQEPLSPRRGRGRRRGSGCPGSVRVTPGRVPSQSGVVSSKLLSTVLVQSRWRGA